MKSADNYPVAKRNGNEDIRVTVPGSKSITNRALVLAALSNKKCILKGVLFSDDSRAVLECLLQLGFDLQIEEAEKKVAIQGCGGKIPNNKAAIHVRSAGTAARFLTVMLAFAGGEYTLQSSEQMKKRPMEPLLSVLRQAGVQISCMEEEGHFPFTIKSDRPQIREVAIDTEVSSQFASALLMTGILLPHGLRVNMEGSRAYGAYIQITLRMMEQFGILVGREGNTCIVPHIEQYGIEEYPVEPDVSGACYFYAMAPLLHRNVLVRNVHRNSMQGDIKFLEILEKMGCIIYEPPEGIWVKGSHITSYPGVDVDMKDYSDQTMTLAAIAPFAVSDTLIRNVGHIRYQESDRIRAIMDELTKIGIVCEEMPDMQGIRIVPGPVTGGDIDTYEDHRMAMAFTLIGLRCGNIIINNPGCCAKTFENYFNIIEEIN